MAKMDVPKQAWPLVNAIYDAILSPDVFGDIANHMSRAFEAPVASLFVYDASDNFLSSSFVGLDTNGTAQYVSHYKNVDCIASSLKTIPPGQVSLRRSPVPDEQLKRTEFYNDWLLRYAPIEGMLASVGSELDVRATINLARYPSQRQFSDRDTRLLGSVLRHFERAMQIATRLKAAAAETRTLQELIDVMAVGVVVLDDMLRLLTTNRRADAILARSPLIGANGERLRPLDRRAAGRLDRLLSDATSGDPRTGGGLRLTDGSDHLTLFVVPLTAAEFGGVARRPAAALFLLERDYIPPEVESYLASVFDLTIAEVATASRLLAGLSIDAIAAELHVSRETVRFHLKGIFFKTDTHSQIDLQRVLGRAVASLDLIGNWRP
jgi:DNA-binding CsgD family transcriptional regulator